MYERICEKCGAHLDPGERCECQGELTETENVDKAAMLTLLVNEIKKLSDKDVKLVKRFVAGLLARDNSERG